MPSKSQSGEELVQKMHVVRDEAAMYQRIIDIRQQLAFLCHDLRTFSANKDAAQRLNSSVHAHFLGPPYLSPQDAKFVHTCDLALLRGPSASSVPTSNATRPKVTLPTYLEEGVDALIKARRAKGEHDPDVERDFVLCTSHDLAPLLQEACGFSKQHFETRTFKDAYKRWEKNVRKTERKAGTGS